MVVDEDEDEEGFLWRTASSNCTVSLLPPRKHTLCFIDRSHATRHVCVLLLYSRQTWGDIVPFFSGGGSGMAKAYDTFRCRRPV